MHRQTLNEMCAMIVKRGSRTRIGRPRIGKKNRPIYSPILRTNINDAFRCVSFFRLSDALFMFCSFCANTVLVLRQRDAKFCNICAKMLLYLIGFGYNFVLGIITINKL